MKTTKNIFNFDPTIKSGAESHMKTTKNIFNFDPTIKSGADIANENQKYF